MTKMNRVAKLASLILLALTSIVASAQMTDEQTKQLDEVFKPWDKKDAAGGVVSISIKGKVVYEKGFGMANLETGTPISTKTIFDVGSVSKQFTAACVMLLQDDGQLNIDDEASKYLPDYPVLRDQKITIRQMMAHTSGLRDYLSLMVFKKGGFVFDDAEVVEALKNQQTLNFRPGAAWDYSNTGFYFLKKIVEKISGKSLAEFAKTRIFEPLGMGDTLFLDDASKLIPGRAFGYVPLPDGLRAGITIVAADGAGGLWTTLADMHKWTQNWKSNKLGSDPNLFTKMQTKTKLTAGQDTTYGLGFFIDEYRGVKRIQHGGDFIGFHAQVNWFPEQDVVVTTFSNDGTQNAKSLNDRAVDIVLAGTLQQPTTGSQTEVKLDPAVLDEYVGVYDLAGRLVEVTRKETQLWVQVSGQPNIEVYATEKDKFFYKIVEARIEFNRNAEGKVEALTIFQGGGQIKCPRGTKYVMPSEKLDAIVGYYYSTELDVTIKIQRTESGLTADSSTILDAFPLLPVSDNRLSAGPLLVTIEWEENRVKAIRVTMSRASNMRFTRLSASPN